MTNLDAIYTELLMRRQHRKVRKRTVLGFWLAFTAICAFIALCWAVS